MTNEEKFLKVVEEIPEKELRKQTDLLLRTLIAKCDCPKPAREDVLALNKCLTQNPALVHKYGDLTDQTFLKLIAIGFSDSISASELLIAEFEQIKEQLGISRAVSGMEKMLIEQAALCWVNLHQVQRMFNNYFYNSHAPEIQVSIDRALTQAQKRFNRACETLTKVRKMARLTPAILEDEPESEHLM
jgi:hypothetical protein